MKIECYPHQLEFKYPFRIAHGVRTHTKVVFVKIAFKNKVGWGEAALPPYLPDTQETVVKACFDFVKLVEGKDLNTAFDYLQKIKSMPAKAGLDMALWNLKAVILGKSIADLMGVKETFSAPKTYTISICDAAEMKLRIADGLANGFGFFKLKLDGKQDERMLNDFRKISNLPIAIDVNQGWCDIDYAINFSKQLIKESCFLIEQPFAKEDRTMSKLLRDRIPIPLIADEACQTLEDIESVKHSFSGINIKLQKCGGITAAYKMIQRAKALKLKVLIGCMSESSIGCDAADNLSSLCDWCDLDGKYLIKNDDFLKRLQ